MEELIREGALRLLTSESSCDVILSCRGYRLMAHKVILSIASPVFQELLRQDDTAPTVMIFPDITGNTMSLILDYIYSGSVHVRSDILPEFMTVANELKLQIDTDSFKPRKYLKCTMEETIIPGFKYSTKTFETDTKTVLDDDQSKCNISKINDSEVNKLVKKCPRKMPGLLPLTKTKRRKVLYNHITPSPWCPRVAPLLSDPREKHLPAKVCHQLTDTKQNDKNNNFKVKSIAETTPPFRENLYKNRRKVAPDERVVIPLSHSDSESDIPSDRGISTDEEGNSLVPLDMKKTSINCNKNKPIAVDVQIDNTKSKSSKAIVESAETGYNEDKTRCNRGDALAPRKCENKKPFDCEDCGKSFSQLRNFKYHRSIHEGTKEFSARCPECGKIFNDKGYLSSHLKIHRDRKEYGCPHCPKRFNQRVAYNMHLRIHTGVKPHECPACGKTFSRKMLLKQHQRVHTGERPYSCPECGKSFADRSNMSLHARLHTGVKPYTCNLCSKSFTKKHHLKTHMNFHTGLKPYSCEKCGLAFSQSSNMRTHYKKCILKPADAAENENS